jgi:hypothetical protein
MNRILGVALVVVIAAALTVITATSEALPPVVATHWGLDGPNGWMSREWYTIFIDAFALGLPLTLLLLVGALPHVMPRAAKLPHRDYWFAAERRAATLRELGRRALLQALGGAVLALGVHLLVLVKNASGNAPPIAVPIVLMGAGIVTIAGTAIATKLHFRRVR